MQSDAAIVKRDLVTYSDFKGAFIADNGADQVDAGLAAVSSQHIAVVKIAVFALKYQVSLNSTAADRYYSGTISKIKYLH